MARVRITPRALTDMAGLRARARDIPLDHARRHRAVLEAGYITTDATRFEIEQLHRQLTSDPSKSEPQR